jgi:ABC-2 type transport system ATP-binding protein
MTSAIHTQDLVKKFRKVTAVDHLNLEVPEGSNYALVGPNGAGKTTAIKILMNIFPPSSGRAEVLGTDSRHVAASAFTSLGYVSENQDLPDWMRVDTFLDYLRPFYPGWDRDLEEAMVKQYDLPRDRKLGKMSRGMRMKAALVSSLAYHPKLIVLDEPFGGLDPLVRDELIEGLLERASETTIFVSSHDLAEVENVASHVGYVEEGKLRFSEEMAALTARFREVELTFDAPPTLTVARGGGFLVPGEGRCSFGESDPDDIQCVFPLTSPFLLARVKSEEINCPIRRNETPLPAGMILYSSTGGFGTGPAVFGLNPVQMRLFFQWDAGWGWNDSNARNYRVRVCPGTPLTLFSDWEELPRYRADLEIDNIRLADYQLKDSHTDDMGFGISLP